MYFVVGREDARAHADWCVQGGNDFEIFSSEKTVGHTVTSPDDTRKQCTELFLS